MPIGSPTRMSKHFSKRGGSGNMPNKRARSSMSLLALGLAVAGILTGCAELQKAAEGVARTAGGERAAGVVRGASTAMSGLLPIGDAEEKVIGETLALQVLARYNGAYDKPAL